MAAVCSPDECALSVCVCVCVYVRAPSASRSLFDEFLFRVTCTHPHMYTYTPIHPYTHSPRDVCSCLQPVAHMHRHGILWREESVWSSTWCPPCLTPAYRLRCAARACRRAVRNHTRACNTRQGAGKSGPGATRHAHHVVGLQCIVVHIIHERDRLVVLGRDAKAGRRRLHGVERELVRHERRRRRRGGLRGGALTHGHVVPRRCGCAHLHWSLCAAVLFDAAFAQGANHHGRPVPRNCRVFGKMGHVMCG